VISRFVPFAIVGLAHLVGLFTGLTVLSGLTKPLLMLALLGAFLTSVPRIRSRVALLGGLGIVLSWAGDVSLASPGDLGFLVGLGFFFGAHVAYLVLFLTALPIRRMRRLSLIFVPWWAIFVALLAPHAGVMLVPIALYGAVLGAVAAAALACNRWVGAGAVFFLASDSLLGLHLFVPGFEFWQVDFTIMLAYILGQGLIAWGAVVHAREAQETRPPVAVAA
jgi:uncharacterized membrane protein YhhN